MSIIYRTRSYSDAWKTCYHLRKAGMNSRFRKTGKGYAVIYKRKS